MWLVPREDLSAEQADVVGLDLSRHRILQGGPGSGKTLALAHRAKAIIEERDVPRDRIRMLVYTRVLGCYMRKGLADLGIEDVCMGFDEWCRALLKEHGVAIPRRGRSIDHDAVRRKARDLLAALKSRPLDVLLVDEAQDLDQVGLEILALASRHVTVALDSRQQLYGHGTDASAVAAALGVRGRPATILGAYRCTPYIVALAAAFIPDPDERSRFIDDNRMPGGPKEQPLLVTSPDDGTELQELAEALKQVAREGRSSLVLLPTNDRVEWAVAGLQASGLKVNDRQRLDFDGATPTVLTYHSAKGLTADAVFLPQLTREAFAGKDDYAARLLFVGVTRATGWVWFGTRADDALPELALLEPLAGQALVKVSAGGTGQSSPSDDDVLGGQDDGGHEDGHDDLLDLAG